MALRVDGMKWLRGLLVLMILVAGAGAAFAQDAGAVEGAPVTHTVTYGDTLYSIALRYGVTIDELIEANAVENVYRLEIGKVLTVPGLTVPDDSSSVENPLIAGTPTDHVIRPGETLAGIAARYGVTVEGLLRSNNIGNPNLILHGQILKVWTTQSAVTETSSSANTQPAAVAVPYTHVVRPGETLGIISRNYAVSLDSLLSANGIGNANLVYSGQVLVIPGRSADASAAPGAQPEVLASVTAPQPTVTEGRQIVVDLSEQRVYAFDNGTLVFTAIASTGLPATPTVLGDFKIYHRLSSQTMSGPGYYLPGVQWVQYFYQGYALHGTYWHNNFGQPMSHGCVNLTNDDALWLYNFGTIGTPVHVKA